MRIAQDFEVDMYDDDILVSPVSQGSSSLMNGGIMTHHGFRLRGSQTVKNGQANETYWGDIYKRQADSMLYTVG